MRILPPASRFMATGIATGAAVLAFTASPSAAQVTFFGDRAGFTSATTGLTTLDFEDEAAANNYTFYDTSSLTKSGVTFTSSEFLFAVGAGYEPGNDFGTGAVLSAQADSDTVPVDFTAFLPGNTTAVGVDFGDWYGSDFTITVSAGGVLSRYTRTGGEAPSVGGFSFAGFTSSTPLTYISFSSPAATAASYDNFAFGAAVPAAGPEAPEPGSLALLMPILGGTGIAGMLIRRRK